MTECPLNMLNYKKSDLPQVGSGNFNRSVMAYSWRGVSLKISPDSSSWSPFAKSVSASTCVMPWISFAQNDLHSFSNMNVIILWSHENDLPNTWLTG